MANTDKIKQAAIAELARRELARRESQTVSNEQDRGSALSIPGQIGEGIVSVAGNLGAMASAGLSGINQAITPTGGVPELTDRLDAPEQPITKTPAADVVRDVQATGQEVFAPESPGGQAVAEGLQTGVEAVGTAIKYPLSAVPFFLGGSDERQEFMETPIGTYLGELAQDNGASPFWATVAHLAPDAAILAGAGAATRIGSKTPVKPPTIAELKQQSSALYKLVDDSGVRIADNAARQAFVDIAKVAQKKGLRRSLTPKSFSAIQEIGKDIAKGQLTLAKAEELRRVLGNAAKALEPADAAIASRAIGQWDKFIEGLKPAQVSGAAGAETAQYLKSARNLWQRARKTEVIEEAIELAGIRAGQFSGSGFENALRTEFRGIARKITKNQLRGFTAAEAKFINRVASGTPLDNAFRGLGKLAPTGVVSAGVGGAAGFAIGGPAGAIALPAVGAISRKIAQMQTAKRAQEASKLVRTGP